MGSSGCWVTQPGSVAGRASRSPARGWTRCEIPGSGSALTARVNLLAWSSISLLGIEEYLPSEGVTVIEWPERITSLLPPQTQLWELEVASLTERVIKRK